MRSPSSSFLVKHSDPAELTLRGALLGILLAVILAASNTYLALKVGILTSASIPAAVLSMSILRFFKNASMLENNLVQTAASAGEAIAGGIVYTIPALVIIHYWTHFDYIHNFMIAFIGGTLGILFSIPLRRTLVQNPQLRFPEAQAIAKILMLQNEDKNYLRFMVKGGLWGAALEFAQSGLQIIGSSIQGFFTIGRTLFGFGAGFSATLIGAGYLIGFRIGLSLLFGAITGWLILIPCLSHPFEGAASPHSTTALQALWENNIRFIGIGAILTAGLWTLLSLIKPMIQSITSPLKAGLFINKKNVPLLRTEKDIPFKGVLVGIFVTIFASYILFTHLLPLNTFAFTTSAKTLLLLGCLLFVVIVGFIFSAICGYFSGLIGVTASPGSAIVIGGLLLAALGLRALLHAHGTLFTPTVIMNACAIAIMLIAVVTGIACISNDNMQDLKVGHLVGATPWKQQLMLWLGVLAASAVIPFLMQLLFHVYGIGGVFPHLGMDPSRMLPAPVPAVLAAITQGVFDKTLPLKMLLIGGGVILIFVMLNRLFCRRQYRLSPLGIALGLYLPLSSSTALFLGSLIAFLIQRRRQRHALSDEKEQRGILLACGLVSGAALMDVLLAIPFAITGNPDMLNSMPLSLQPMTGYLGIISVFILIRLFYKITR